jgi:hypothetical protein
MLEIKEAQAGDLAAVAISRKQTAWRWKSWKAPASRLARRPLKR